MTITFKELFGVAVGWVIGEVLWSFVPGHVQDFHAPGGALFFVCVIWVYKKLERKLA